MNIDPTREVLLPKIRNTLSVLHGKRMAPLGSREECPSLTRPTSSAAVQIGQPPLLKTAHQGNGLDDAADGMASRRLPQSAEESAVAAWVLPKVGRDQGWNRIRSFPVAGGFAPTGELQRQWEAGSAQHLGFLGVLGRDLASRCISPPAGHWPCAQPSSERVGLVIYGAAIVPPTGAPSGNPRIPDSAKCPSCTVGLGTAGLAQLTRGRAPHRPSGSGCGTVPTLATSRRLHA